MCGLAAIFSYSPSAPPVDQAELLRIREAMISYSLAPGVKYQGRQLS